MPYQLEKGPYFAVTESLLDDIPRRIEALARSRGGDPIDDMPGLDSASLVVAPSTAAAALLAGQFHQNHDWYGMNLNPVTGKWDPQPPFSQGNRTTGYWHNWYGNPDLIMRETFIRAIEVSLGVPHDPKNLDTTSIAVAKKHEWPIEVFWRCPAPWFETWVTWRGTENPGQSTDKTGHVTVHVHSPSHDNAALIESPIRSAPDNARAEYKDEPNTPNGPYLSSDNRERGMWVIAHRNQDPVIPIFGPITTAVGQIWGLPNFGSGYHSHGEIVAVQPNEPDGGVKAAGRPYRRPRP
jgi:hypothetical protein